MALPQIPRPTMTGIRTLISSSGEQSWRRTQLMDSRGELDGMRSHILIDRTVDVEYP